VSRQGLGKVPQQRDERLGRERDRARKGHMMGRDAPGYAWCNEDSWSKTICKRHRNRGRQGDIALKHNIRTVLLGGPNRNHDEPDGLSDLLEFRSRQISQNQCTHRLHPSPAFDQAWRVSAPYD
jgi:hypothetical protein